MVVGGNVKAQTADVSLQLCLIQFAIIYFNENIYVPIIYTEANKRSSKEVE